MGAREAGKATPAQIAAADRALRLGGWNALLAYATLEPPWTRHFNDPKIELRRMFSEIFGTFLLVVVAAGAVVVDARNGGVSRSAAVVAPGVMVMSIILFMGNVSGAHLNPAVTVGFALRGDFPWRRVPGYIVAQLAGALGACGVLRLVLGDHGSMGATVPGAGVSDAQTLVIEALLTLGLVSTILGTSSRAQNVGPLSAVAVGGYIALAGLWASPISGASMNPARSLGPAVVAGSYAHITPYILGPLVGAVLAVGAAYVLRGPGGDSGGVHAAQGALEGLGVESTAVATPEAREG